MKVYMIVLMGDYEPCKHKAVYASKEKAEAEAARLQEVMKRAYEKWRRHDFTHDLLTPEEDDLLFLSRANVEEFDVIE